MAVEKVYWVGRVLSRTWGLHMQEPTVSADRIVSSARTLVRRTIRILKGCGLSEPQLQEILAQEVPIPDSVLRSPLTAATARELIISSDVVLKWRRDSRFLSLEGLPAILSLDCTAPSFRDLVREVSPAIDPIDLFEKMKELGVIRVLGIDKIELISDSIVACPGQDGSPIASEFVLEHICGFLGSVEYNLFEKSSRAKGRFERACYASVPDKLVAVLENLVNSRGQDFVDVIDEWLARRAIQPTGESKTVLVGAGAYVFIRENIC